jgi:hypothetical protein
MSETDKLIRAIETGAVITLGWMSIKVIVSWVFQNWILLAVLFALVWVHDAGTGRRSRVEKINNFPTSSVTVSDVAYQKPSGVPDYFTATVKNDGPARIYDLTISCNMQYRTTASADDSSSKVKTTVNLGYINPGETARLRLNADGSGLRLMENIRLGDCSPNFTPEINDMLKLGKVQ